MQKPILESSILAAEALTPKLFVDHDGNICAAGEKSRGICQVSTDAGDMAGIGVIGEFIVTAGGAVAIGDQVESDASGRAITQSAGEVNGRALTAAAAAGDEIVIVHDPVG